MQREMPHTLSRHGKHKLAIPDKELYLKKFTMMAHPLRTSFGVPKATFIFVQVIKEELSH